MAENKQLRYKLVPIAEYDAMQDEIDKMKKELKKAKKTISKQEKSIMKLEKNLDFKNCETRTLCEDYFSLEEDFIEITDICNEIIDISFTNNLNENSVTSLQEQIAEQLKSVCVNS